MNFRKVSFRPTVEGQRLLSDLASRYGSGSVTQLMNSILDDLRRLDVAGVGDPVLNRMPANNTSAEEGKHDFQNLRKDESMSILLKAFLEQQVAFSQYNDAQGLLINRINALERDCLLLRIENARLSTPAPWTIPVPSVKSSKDTEDENFERMLKFIESLKLRSTRSF